MLILYSHLLQFLTQRRDLINICQKPNEQTFVRHVKPQPSVRHGPEFKIYVLLVQMNKPLSENSKRKKKKKTVNPLSDFNIKSPCEGKDERPNKRNWLNKWNKGYGQTERKVEKRRDCLRGKREMKHRDIMKSHECRADRAQRTSIDLDAKENGGVSGQKARVSSALMWTFSSSLIPPPLLFQVSEWRGQELGAKTWETGVLSSRFSFVGRP